MIDTSGYVVQDTHMKTKTNSKPATATPGPWTVGVYVENDYEPAYFPVERDERDASGFVKDVVPLIAKVTYGANDEAKLANAKLLCAAPDLLAACRHLLAFFKSEYPEAFKAGGGSFATDDRAPFELDLAAAKAAIKKATK